MPSPADPWDNSKGILELLLKSEDKIKNLRETVIKETGKHEYTLKRETVMLRWLFEWKSLCSIQAPLAVGNGRKAGINGLYSCDFGTDKVK